MTPQKQQSQSTEKSFDRPLPSNPDAEKGILGSILLDAKLMDQAGVLRPDDFYHPHYRPVFDAMLELRSKQKPIDPFTIADILRQKHSLDRVGGTSAITNLSFGMPYAESIEHWVASVQEKAALRLLVKEYGAFQDLALAENMPASKIVELADARLNDLIKRPIGAHPRPIGSLWAEHRSLRPAVIEGLVRRGEVMNIIAKSKVGKSWLTYNIAYSVALGFKLFDQFQCYQGKVLIIDNELHLETISSRLATVRDAWGIRPDDVADQIDVITLRGNLTDINQLGRTLAGLKPGVYQFVIVDALYRMQPTGSDENSNAAIAQIYNRLDQYAAILDAPIAVVHHASKGGQGDKDVTDVGSGAGAMSRAADTHLVLRPHQDDNCVVLEAALRSWAPVDPIALKWNFPIWRRADDVDVTALKGRKPAFEEQRQAKDDAGMQEVLDALICKPDTIRGLTTRVPMGYERIKKLIAGLSKAGKISSVEVRNRGQLCDLYSPI